MGSERRIPITVSIRQRTAGDLSDIDQGEKRGERLFNNLGKRAFLLPNTCPGQRSPYPK
jgi:hypothetical protein